MGLQLGRVLQSPKGFIRASEKTPGELAAGSEYTEALGPARRSRGQRTSSSRSSTSSRPRLEARDPRRTWSLVGWESVSTIIHTGWFVIEYVLTNEGSNPESTDPQAHARTKGPNDNKAAASPGCIPGVSSRGIPIRGPQSHPGSGRGNERRPLPPFRRQGRVGPRNGRPGAPRLDPRPLASPCREGFGSDRRSHRVGSKV